MNKQPSVSDNTNGHESGLNGNLSLDIVTSYVPAIREELIGKIVSANELSEIMIYEKLINEALETDADFGLDLLDVSALDSLPDDVKDYIEGLVGVEG